MISVIIPLYNKAEQVGQTLRSVLAQTFQEFEVVVVDDGSTDGSVEKVRSVQDGRIRIIGQQNAGVAAARNRGIAEARYDLVAFLDADDEWKPTYLETQYNLAQKYKDCDVYACNYEFRNAAGKVTPTILRKLPFSGNDGILNNYFVVASCSHPPLWTSAVMVRKSAIQAVGGFPVGIKSGEDLLTWARLVINGKVAFSKQVGAVYDLGAGYDFANLPPRRQDAGDPVGQQLQQLYKSNKHIKGFRSYLSHWHKMRASVAIRFGERIETIKESFISLQYNPFNYKILPFIVLSILPSKIRTNIIRRHG